MKNDPFDMLGVSRSAAPDDIKKAFRKLAKMYHPDLKSGSEEKFKRILLAYEEISGGNYQPANRKQHFDYFVKVDIERKQNKVQDVFDDLIDGILTAFDLDKPEYLDLYIGLNKAEAERGGRLKLDLPLVRKCRRCFGSGRPFLISCSKCGGTGEEKYRRDAYIDLPERLGNNARDSIRVDNLHLNVIFKIDR